VIVQYKTAYYSFILPVKLAFLLANITDAEQHTFAEQILLQIGEFFQIQDDYLDFYGNPEVTGKIGTDIQDNKCSWLIVNALVLADEDQKTKLCAHYGRADERDIQIVSQVYHELKLDKLYERFSVATEEKIMDKILNDCSENLREVYLGICKYVFKRIF